MKLILLCIAVGAATATSYSNVVGDNSNPAAPKHNNELLGQQEHTATWISTSSSTAQQGSHIDHTLHSDAINDTLSIQPTHAKDERVLTTSFGHTRHPNLADTSNICNAITCNHESRQYNGMETSSIVVTHRCHNTTDASDPNGLGVWGDQFKTTLANDDAVKQAKKHCAVETVCTSGHVCGIVIVGSAAKCQCHKWANLSPAHYPTRNAATSFNNATVPRPVKADGQPLATWTQPSS